LGIKEKMPDLQAKFETATQEVQQLSERPDNETLLRLYALYKQATVGDVSGKRPRLTDFVGRAKFDAWARMKGTWKEEAMQAYIDFVGALKAK
jgi:diazepam-binding inhibitor (GABA receptor modulating acyl-CoA-binding protein)